MSFGQILKSNPLQFAIGSNINRPACWSNFDASVQKRQQQVRDKTKNV